jgi:cytochrome b6-f complex iron-sulfur subunit
MPSSESRRDFLANVAVAATVIPGFGVAGAHVVQFLVPPEGEQVKEVLLGKLSDFAIQSARMLQNVHGNNLIAVRTAKDQLLVFSSVCTHLGCAVKWDPTAGSFHCPCHDARFDTAGKVLSGPPEEPLPAYPVRVEADNIFVTVPVREA